MKSLLLGIAVLEAAIIGSVVATLSPVVIVLKLMNEGYERLQFVWL